MLEKGRFKKVWVWIFTIMIVSVSSGCENDESAIDVGTRNRNMNVGSNNTQMEASLNEVKEDKIDGTVGEAIPLAGQELTVTKVERSEGNENDKPMPGRTFTIVSVQIKNTGKGKLPYKYYYFDIINNKGEIIQQSGTAQIDIDTTLQSGELGPGEIVTGTIVFEMPISQSAVKLRYLPSTGANAIVDLES